MTISEMTAVVNEATREIDRLRSVNAVLVQALAAHRDYHDVAAQVGGTERCDCPLCLKDDFALKAATEQE
jgi:hypothetical protein